MTDRPILFSAPMVRAILAGTKTQTRRVVKPQPHHRARNVVEPFADGRRWFVVNDPHEDGTVIPLDKVPHCPYGQPGDGLWVRETWKLATPLMGTGLWPFYRATAHKWDVEGKGWKPSIHMPRKYSRITLEVTNVRVEQLQDISDSDALAEGIVATHGGYGLPDGSHFHGADPRQSYLSLWEAINGVGSVEANPWVWVVEFRRAAQTGGAS